MVSFKFLLGMDVCVRQSVFQMKEFFKGSLFTFAMLIILKVAQPYLLARWLHFLIALFDSKDFTDF